MKIRTGFVSNSSSSSFVVAFPHRPNDVEETKKMLFGKQEWHYVGHFGETEEDVPTAPIAEKVFNNITRAATKQEVIESIANGWFDDYLGILPGYSDCMKDPEYESFKSEYPKDIKKIVEICEKHNKINRKRAEEIADFFIKINEDKFIVVMSFSDQDGEEIEEHTDIFKRLEHIKTSYH